MMLMIVEICIGSDVPVLRFANASGTGTDSRLANLVQMAACDTIVAYIHDRLSKDAASVVGQVFSDRDHPPATSRKLRNYGYRPNNKAMDSGGVVRAIVISK